MKITLDKAKPPLAGLLVAEHLRASHAIEICWGDSTMVDNADSTVFRTNNGLCRFLARSLAESDLYGADPIEKTEIDHWLSYSLGPLKGKHWFERAVPYLNKILGPITYLVGKRVTIADFSVFAALYVNKNWLVLLEKNKVPSHLLRWYNFILNHKTVAKALSEMSEEVKCSLNASVNSIRQRPAAGQRAQEGKFVDLPDAEMGKVVVRFPPEASGYLHIGHAKAALLNQYYQQAFDGKLIMRFDDTNPAKENVHFEQVILEDLEMLEIKPDQFTHTSNYFDLMLQYCERLITDGKAYVDDTEPETMKLQREQRVECANRSNPVDKNFALWGEMKQGSPKGQKCCVRAKIDMQSHNGCMRDPTIYRCKNEIHPRTGDKYKVYPTYDFACPIVDAIEGVTHTLRTMEYHDRDPQFYWFIEALGLRRPFIWEYSRLSMTNTVLSKRKLTWFVQEGLVDGWDDPRFPTVRGVLRRGMTVEGLRQFIIAQGSSKSVVFMEWDKIWAFNKKVIDPIASRFIALDSNDPVPVLVSGVVLESLQVLKHPKNAEYGSKTVWVGPRVLIDRVDAEALKENENTTFINWGNLLIKKINRQNGKITSVEAEPNLDDKDYKKTLKLTWLCDTDKAPFIPCYCVYFEHIISKGVLAKDEDFKTYIGHETRTEVRMLGDPELKSLKQGEVIQLQRRGFFKCDVTYAPANDTCFKERPVVLFEVPDGRTKENPTAGAPKQVAVPSKQINKQSIKTPATVNSEIIAQGDKVRNLKAQKASKTDIDSAVKALLELKLQFKALSGSDWKPGCVVSTEPTSTDLSVNIQVQSDLKTQKAALKPSAGGDAEILVKIAQQGDKIRDLKAQKSEKSVIEPEVKTLLGLKADYKALMGKDWKPGTIASPQTIAPTSAQSAESVNEVLDKIGRQGDVIRRLKYEKSDKASIDTEVKVLLGLKADYKALTGKDWKPGTIVEPKLTSSTPQSVARTSTSEKDALTAKINDQGDVVRNLKTSRGSKTDIDAAVKVLLDLKSAYKSVTGTDFPAAGRAPKESKVKAPKEAKPAALISTESTMEATSDIDALTTAINDQGDVVRNLKTSGGSKADIDAAVKVLLDLKSAYKSATGTDFPVAGRAPKESKVKAPKEAKPAALTSTESTREATSNIDALTKTINDHGDVVRNLKTSGVSKTEIDAAVKVLLELKSAYKSMTGTDFPAGRASKAPKSAQKKAPTKEKKPVDVPDEATVKKQTRLGLEAKKEEDLSDWYSQVITKGEMIEYYDVSGCYIYRPWSYAIWELIKDWFDGEIKKLGVQNCYFPIFVSRSVLEKEKTHIADFAPEVAWVTKSGDSEMAEPIAVRPTSETVMYPAYAKWIQSYRDLPIKLNQWNNVVRWEFKHPQPFLRTREFLWQEGHTAFATQEEATAEVTTILDLYARIYTDLLAIPVVKGRKTEKEKFAGGDYTLTVEAYVSASGRAIQGATSHHLGQNFSRMFDITYEDPETQEKKHVFQNSWGVTTRTIGVMIMIHADNQGLVLPPQVASVQIVIVPCGITVSLPESDKIALQTACDSLESDLRSIGVRVKGDYRNNYSPGWKFNHWELKGVPIRIELGPKDLKNKQLVAVRRDTGEKITIKRDIAVAQLEKLLETIQKDLFDKAQVDLNTHIVQLKDWALFTQNLDNKNMILAPFCGEIPCEDNIKGDSARDDVEVEAGAPAMGAKSLCIPLEQPSPLGSTDRCIHPLCEQKPKFWTLFGRSY